MDKIVLHVIVSHETELTKDQSGYSANDDIAHLTKDLADFAVREVNKLREKVGRPVTVKRAWITIEAQ